MVEGNLGCNILALSQSELYSEAAKRIVELAHHAIADHGRFMLAISGGDAPKLLYERLASASWRTQVDWTRTHIFWGDERVVPPDDEASNYRMAKELLLSHLSIPPNNIHRVETEAGIPRQVAQSYEQTLRDTFGVARPEVPRFDLILLGMGENGHTASLFPHSPLLEEKQQLIGAEFVKEVGQWRVTMTPPLINNAQEIIFLVTGVKKAAMVRNVIAGGFAPELYPAQIVRPANGTLTWMLDTPAASVLSETAA